MNFKQLIDVFKNKETTYDLEMCSKKHPYKILQDSKIYDGQRALCDLTNPAHEIKAGVEFLHCDICQEDLCKDCLQSIVETKLEEEKFQEQEQIQEQGLLTQEQ